MRRKKQPEPEPTNAQEDPALANETQIRKLFTVALKEVADEEDIEMTKKEQGEIVEDLVGLFGPGINAIVEGAISLVVSDALDDDDNDDNDDA